MIAESEKPQLKHTIYPHGGSRIYTEDSSGKRDLLAETYQTKEFATAVASFIERWLSDENTSALNPEIANVVDWLINGFVGLSSKTMASVALGVAPQEVNYPRDISDFHRCLMLVHHAPIVRESFSQIGDLCPEWSKVINAWDDLEAAFIEEAGIKWEKSSLARNTSRKFEHVLYGKEGDR